MISTEQINPNKIRQVFFLAIIIILGGILIKETYFLFSGFLGAITMYILMRKLFFRLTEDHKWNKWLAILTLSVISLILIVLPFAWAVYILIQKAEPLINNPEILKKDFTIISKYLEDNFDIDILDPDNLGEYIGKATSLAPAMLGSTLQALSNILLMYFLLYFMLSSGRNMETWVRTHIPIKKTNIQKVLKEVKEMVISNAIGIPVLAAVQGIVAIIGYWIFGVENFVLLGIITGICSIIPVIGTMATWVPITAYTFASGNTGNAIAIGLWGLIVIGSSDNIFRFILQKKIADIHPLITLFGVIIGINLFGFIGLVFGPLMISLFFLLTRVYIDEFSDLNPNTKNRKPPVTTTTNT